MSTSIDNRIVQMTFDNKQFEAAVKQSMNSLENLDNTIKNAGNDRKSSGMFKGFSKLGKVFNFADLNASIESIKNRFSTFGIVGMTVIQNLTNGALNLAKKGLGAINNALFTGGWTRANNLEQALFRLKAMTGSAKQVKLIMEDVGRAVDGTAFGLDEAAVAASMFAATGMRSGDEMYQTLLSIAGMASTAGVSYEQMANIMTDAAAQGVATNDTFTRLAMQGIPAAILMADKLGLSVEDLKDKASEGKITFSEFAEVMSKKYADAAKDANKTFSGSLTNLLTAFKRNTEPFFTEIRTGLIDVFNELREAVNEVGQGFSTIMPSFKKWNEYLSGGLLDAIKKFRELGTFKDFGSILAKSFYNLRKVIVQIRDAFNSVFDVSFVDLVDKIGQKIWAAAIDFGIFLDKTRFVEKIFTAFFKVLKTGWKVIEHFVKVAKKLKEIFKDITLAFSPVMDVIRGISGGFLKMVEAIITELDKIDLLGKLGKLIHSVAGLTTEILQSAFETVAGMFGAFGETLGESFDKLFDILIAGGILNILISAKKTFKSMKDSFDSIKDLTKEMKNLGESLVDIPGTLNKTLQSLRKTLKQWQKSLKALELLGIAVALLVTAHALEKLSKLKYTQIVKGMGAIAGSLTLLLIAMAILDKIGDGSKIKKDISDPMDALKDVIESFKKQGDPSGVLIKLAASALLMAKAIEIIGNLDTDQAIRGCFGLVIVLGAMVAAAKLLSTKDNIVDTKRIQKGMSGLIFMAISMRIMASAIKALGEMSWEQLDNALTAMTVIIGEVVVFGKLMSKHGKIFTEKTPVVSFIMFAISMRIMGSALQKLAEIPWDGLQNALAAMFMVLMEIAMYSAIMSKAKVGVQGGGAFLMMSVGLILVAKALQMLSSIPMQAMTDALSVLIGLLITLAGVMVVAEKFALGSLALSIAAGALIVFAIALGMLAAIPIDNLATALVGLVAALAIIAVAMIGFSLAAGPMIGGILLLAAASVSLGIFAAALMGLGVALTAVGGGFTAIAAGIAALWKVVSAIIGQIWDLLKRFVAWLGSFAEEDVPETIDGGKEKAKEKSKDLGNAIVSSLKNAILKKLKSFLPSFKKGGTNVASSLGTGLKGKIKDLPKIVGDGIKKAWSKIKEKAKDWYNSGTDLIKGVGRGIRDGASHLISAASDMAKKALNKFKDMLGIESPSKVFAEAASWIPKGAAKGIKKNASVFYNSIDEMSRNSIDGLRSAIKDAFENSGMNDDFNPVITPVLDLSNVEQGAKSIGSLLGASRVSASLAGGISANPKYNLNDNINNLTDSIKNLGKNQNGIDRPNNYINIKVDGAENPEDFANRFLRQLQIEMRAG